MTPQSYSLLCGPELSLSDMLADPMVQALMKSDGVTRRQLNAAIDSVGNSASPLDSPEEPSQLAVSHGRR